MGHPPWVGLWVGFLLECTAAHAPAADDRGSTLPAKLSLIAPADGIAHPRWYVCSTR
jgi:hypothetical protein